MAEGSRQDTKNIEIFTVPGQGYSMSGSFRFGFAQHEEQFGDVVQRLDIFMLDLRNAAVKKIAEELKLKVNFVQ
jgi:hypothetical protein